MQALSVTLGNGVRMPRLGFGTWQLDERAAERATALALQVGFRSVDTSEAYGNERGVGRAVRDSGLARDEVFVTTKVLDREGHDNVVRSFHASLGRLGLDFVDLYLIHWPQDGYTAETWRAMERLHADGVTRAIGVANFGVRRLDALLATADTPPAVDQVELHPRLAQRPLRAHCAARGVQVESWSPLMQGGDLLTDPVPRSTSLRHLEENAGITGFVLDPEEMAAVDALDRGERANPHADPETYVFSQEVYERLKTVNGAR